MGKKDSTQQIIKEWLKTHSPTELLDPTMQLNRKKKKNKKNKNEFSQYPITPNKKGIKIFKGGGCSPK